MPDDDDALWKIAREIYTAVEAAGGCVDLLCILGSFRDTLGDDEILDLLVEFNKGAPIMSEGVVVQ